MSRFRKPTEPVAHLLQPTSCQQGDTETAQGYAQRLKSLAYKTWPQFTQSQDEPIRQLDEKLIYQHFLNGLKPSKLDRIHLKSIGDTDTAMIELTNKETTGCSDEPAAPRAASIPTSSEQSPAGSQTVHYL
ncbi:hypothetical protein FJT64_000710 [Amphibalanus amphitrite]|uniref:Uncharacterized protein n=1 Tax=Amphibalanus amphitrite TaxID=1232801 RepID=A0A6A4VEN6_AMPAM|nr:hypothetical protein FJT64_000710 [Amphibalanus amphitrite]